MNKPRERHNRNDGNVKVVQSIERIADYISIKIEKGREILMKGDRKEGVNHACQSVQMND